MCTPQVSPDAVHCAPAGKARVFQCLQEHLGEPNFGRDCLEQVEARAQRMQEDYRLDYGVSTQCKEGRPHLLRHGAGQAAARHGGRPERTSTRFEPVSTNTICRQAGQARLLLLHSVRGWLDDADCEGTPQAVSES